MDKIELKIERVSMLLHDIHKWKSFSESELKNVIKQFEKYPREEISRFYIPYFTDDLVENMIQIGKANKKDTDMLCNLISILGNIIVRYNVKSTDEVFDFFVKLSHVKKVNYYVSLFIVYLPQFKVWENKWYYIISIPNIAPKKRSRDNFFLVVKRLINNGENIPEEYKPTIRSLLYSFIEDNNLSNHTKNEYIGIANLIPQFGITECLI